MAVGFVEDVKARTLTSASGTQKKPLISGFIGE